MDVQTVYSFLAELSLTIDIYRTYAKLGLLSLVKEVSVDLDGRSQAYKNIFTASSGTRK
jgi:hypothetical protein